MQIHLTDADGTPIYLQLVQQIKFLVASGRLPAGEQLPSVRKLSRQLTITPNTVARAYRELERAGVIATRQGAGAFVSDAGSPLSRKEKVRILQERMDALLTEARHLGVDVDTLIRLLRQRDDKFPSPPGVAP